MKKVNAILGPRAFTDHEEAANWCLSNEYDTGFLEFTFNLGLCYYRGSVFPITMGKLTSGFHSSRQWPQRGSSFDRRIGPISI